MVRDVQWYRTFAKRWNELRDAKLVADELGMPSAASARALAIRMRRLNWDLEMLPPGMANEKNRHHPSRIPTPDQAA